MSLLLIVNINDDSIEIDCSIKFDSELQSIVLGINSNLMLIIIISGCIYKM